MLFNTLIIVMIILIVLNLIFLLSLVIFKKISNNKEDLKEIKDFDKVEKLLNAKKINL